MANRDSITRSCWLALAPLTFVTALPWLLLAVHAGRLPDRAYVHGWSRLGPEYAHLVPTWTSWAAGYLYLLLFAGGFGVALWRYRRWPRLRRRLVTFAWGISGLFAAEIVLAVTPWLDPVGAVSVLAGIVGALAGRALSGSPPPGPAAVGGPPEGVPVRRLGPAERAMFTESMWSVRAALTGVALVLCVPLLVLVQSWSALALVLLLMGMAKVLGAKAKVQIDGDGVLLDLPLLRVRHRVPYRSVRYAEVDRIPSRSWWPLVENARYWGFVVDRRPVLVLALSGDRPFAAGLRDATVAAALVNGELSRLRADSC
ncbi:hypothetical protein [Amycolatopsis sp. YIM 10]|uniref:hypothetical protein n=1 Tax=Amycolatopsis sp. YIM 10 TaxID=2653857 RepID=UPI00129022F8|nr:hypothetical protein [Amycolatopsis sp. YIM 10]QFU92684.1 hypothetical protein YIM_37635 [Amycolatopsis sp. YIM 10]